MKDTHNDIEILREVRELAKAFKEYQETMSPILEAYQTANNVGDAVIWVSKVILAMGVVVGMVWAALHLPK